MNSRRTTSVSSAPQRRHVSGSWKALFGRKPERSSFSFAEAAAGWHNAELERGTSETARNTRSPTFRKSNDEPRLLWLLKPETAAATIAWLRGLLIEAAKAEGLDHSFLESRSARSGWDRVISELAGLKSVLLHADMHDGQLVLQPGAPVIRGVIDWDNFCAGNPLVDFNTSKWFPDRMWLFRKDFHEMRVEMWQRYLERRGIADPVGRRFEPVLRADRSRSSASAKKNGPESG